MEAKLVYLVNILSPANGLKTLQGPMIIVLTIWNNVTVFRKKAV